MGFVRQRCAGFVIEHEVQVGDGGAAACIRHDDRVLASRPHEQQVEVVGEAMGEALQVEVDVGDHNPGGPKMKQSDG